MTADRANRLWIEPLNKQHRKDEFVCGVDSLDDYLKLQASQDIRRKANAVFVLVPRGDSREIVGYFTLCAYALSPGVVPEEARKHIPRYPLVSATLLGRLAVDRRHQGNGVGSMLLAEVLKRAYQNADVVGSCMVVVDAIDERAAAFYGAHGFIRLPESLRLVLPMRTIAELAADGTKGR